MKVQDLCLPLLLPSIFAEHVDSTQNNDSILLRLLRSRMCIVLAGEPGRATGGDATKKLDAVPGGWL